MNQRFFQDLLAKGQRSPQSIAFPESSGSKVLQAAEEVWQRGIAKPILIGEPGAICQGAERAGVKIDNFSCVDHTDEQIQESLITGFLAVCNDFSAKTLARKFKQPLNFAAALVRLGKADCLAAGIDYSTGEVLLASQSFIGLKEGVETISSIGIVDAPSFSGSQGNFLVIGDCAVCQNPTSSELADIAVTAADTVRSLLGWEPRVALICYSTDGSGEGEMTEKVVEAVRLAQARRPDLLIDGEFQFDAAVDPVIAGKKVKRDSRVAGRANVIIFPDLNAGNIGVKLIQRFGNALAYGPVLQGFARPVTDFSRSAPVEEIVGNLIMLVARAG
ncbi:MAG: phosphate acyltransferase [Desulfopila sp.]